MYVCIYIYIYTYIYTHTHTHTHTSMIYAHSDGQSEGYFGLMRIVVQQFCRRTTRHIMNSCLIPAIFWSASSLAWIQTDI